jgi:hypothetical protein
MQQMSRVFILQATIGTTSVLRAKPSTHIPPTGAEFRTLLENPHFEHIRLWSETLVPGLPINIVKRSCIPSKLGNIEFAGLYQSNVKANIAAALAADLVTVVENCRGLQW